MSKQYVGCQSIQDDWGQELHHTRQTFQYLTELAETKLIKNKDRANTGISCGGQEEKGL